MSASLSTQFSFYNKSHHIISLWHNRLDHPNSSVLHQLFNTLHFSVSSKFIPQFCNACQFGKLHQITYSSSSLKTMKPFQLIHSDISHISYLTCPSHISLDGYKYYLSFVDDFSRYVWIYPVHLNSEVPLMNAQIMCFYILILSLFLVLITIKPLI